MHADRQKSFVEFHTTSNARWLPIGAARRLAELELKKVLAGKTGEPMEESEGKIYRLLLRIRRRLIDELGTDPSDS